MSQRGIITEWKTEPGGRSWFFGIGIDSYLNFPELHNAVKDLRDVYAILLDRYDISDDSSTVLINEDATEEKIIGQLETLAQTVSPADKLLIYYSGHGHLNRGTNLAYWIPVDARQGVSSDYIPNSTIRDLLAANPARHIFLVSDSCYSGTLFLRGSLRSTRVLDELEKTPSRWALCSGRANEEVADGSPGINSPFATSLLEALQDNDYDAWNVSRLVERVRDQTAASTFQVPDGGPLRVEGHKGGQYVFRKKGSIASTGEDSSIPTGNQFYSQSRTTDESTGTTPLTPEKVKPPFKRWAIAIFITLAIVVVGLWMVRSYVLDKPTGDVASASAPPVADVVAFHTTSAVNENLWPADQRDRFEAGSPVFLFGQVFIVDTAQFEIAILGSSDTAFN